MLVPTNAIAAARSRVKQPDLFRIATNTPAFEEYGLNMMLAVANETRSTYKCLQVSVLTIDTTAAPAELGAGFLGAH